MRHSRSVCRLGPGRHTPGAVSYTHLDVYKRQVTPLVAETARALMDAGLFNIRNQGVLLRGINDTPKAVSYTHLDVYKRQAKDVAIEKKMIVPSLSLIHI